MSRENVFNPEQVDTKKERKRRKIKNIFKDAVTIIIASLAINIAVDKLDQRVLGKGLEDVSKS